MSCVVGIVLAAGSSRRLGRPKQTLPLGDTTLLGRVVEHVEASSLERVVVVVGGAAGEVRASLRPRRAQVVDNAAHGSGCASSLRAGLEAAGACDAILLLLGDMPGVDAAVVDAVRRGWERRRPWGQVTAYDDGPGHPFAFSSAAFPTLQALHGDKAVWKLLDADPSRFARVRVNRALPRDVDTWEDYEALAEAAPPTGHRGRAGDAPAG